jgi:hypothetical protein
MVDNEAMESRPTFRVVTVSRAGHITDETVRDLERNPALYGVAQIARKYLKEGK